jgi:NAD(P)-dependent dehydrogenase (short-subunit alcohol dehydrogenase family)
MNHNPFSLTNKNILITGASSGIGRATALECAKMGARVVITGRDQTRLNDTFLMLEGGGHDQLIADLGNPAEVDELVNYLPVLHGCVHGAGFTRLLLTQFINSEDLGHVFQVNTMAPIMLTQRLVKEKKLTKPSSIVFISSVAGVYNVSPGNAMYSASKGALNGFMKNAALDLAPKGIRCNSVNPGMVQTNIMHDGTISEAKLEDYKKRYPLNRFGQPEEVAYAIIYLLSDASAWVTGTALLIDGGLTLH